MKKIDFSISHWLYNVPIILISGLLYYFSTGLDGFGPLVWFAPIPIMIFALRSTARAATGAAFFAYLLGGCNLFFYLMQLRIPIGQAGLFDNHGNRQYERTAQIGCQSRSHLARQTQYECQKPVRKHEIAGKPGGAEMVLLLKAILICLNNRTVLFHSV